MRTCPDCGFENAEVGKACPLCGGSSTARAFDAVEEATLQFPTTRRIGLDAPAPERRASALGRVFAGRYRVDALLGSGGMGEVYRVRDLQEATDRALKILHPTDAPDAERAARFRREAQILSKIQHPAVPRILDAGAEGDELYFVTELVDGHDLKLAIQKRGPWPVAEAAALAATVADALAAAHALGIVHRDVKPNNVMLEKDGSPRLVDFGLARGRGVDMATLTRTGVIVGTPAYMSPEQLQALAIDERTDVYSLGVVLYELVTARLPFSAPTPMALAVKHLMEPAPSPRALRSEVPVWLDRIVLQCLEKDPSRRFPSAASLAAELSKDRSGGTGRLRLRRLPTGDHVVEDASDSSEWALVLQSAGEKTGWSAGMALRFADRYYRLEELTAPSERSARFTYRFSAWPDGVIFRKLIDYDQDALARAAFGQTPLRSKIARLFTGHKE